MKNRLLFSTALVAVLSATNVYAADLSGKVERPDNINIGSSTEYTIDNAYSEQSGDLDEGTLYTSTVNVDKGGKLTVSSSDIVADGSGDAVTLKGTVILDGTSIMAGNKYPDAKQNMIIDGADITFNTTSDLLSATGDLNVSNASINASSLVADDEGDEEDLSGLRSLGNITIDNSKIDMSDLMIVSGMDNPDGAGEPLGEGNITISGNSDIKVKEIGVYGKGDININGGNITAQDIGAEQGNITISNGSVNVIEGGEGLYARNTLNIKGGTVNIDGSDAKFSDMLAQNSQIDGGTINLNYGHLGVNEELDITGGDINMNVGEIDAQTVNVNGGKINMIGETGLSGSTIAISGGEITQQGTQQDRSGIWGTSTISGDAVINMKGYASIDENSTLSINGGTINVSGTDNVFGSVNDVAMSGGELNIAQGADLSLHKLESTTPDAAYGTGRIFLNEGQINLGGTINGDITGSDRGKIYFENSAAQINGNVDSASLIFKNSHTLSEAITGELGGLDIFEIQKGTLVYDKNIESGASSVVVGNGATLDIGTNALHSGGEKEVEGEGVFFKDNSTLKFALTDKDTYGKIYANYVNISENGTTLDLSLNGAALSEGDNPLIIKLFNGEDLAEAEIEGKFANLTTNSRYDFTDNKDGTYTVTSNGTTASDIVSDAGGTSSNASTAEAWDSVSAEKSSPVAAAVTEKLAELSNSTDAASQKAYIDALTAVAPEVAPMVQKTQSETANQVFGAVSTRLTGGSVSTGGEGMSSGDNIFERAAMWVQGLFNKSKLDDTSKSYGFDADSSGVAMGAEKYVTEDTKIGLGYAYTNTDIDGFMRSTDVDTHTAFVYGEYKPSNWYVNGIASYGWSDYSENKNVSGIGVKADYDAETFGLQAMTGYDMQVKGFGLTPEVGLRYVHISQDGYTDSADQKVSGNASDILTGVIGAKVSKTWTLENGMNIKPEARIAATYDLMNDDVNSVVTLANGSAYAVEGDALDRFGMEFGAGVTTEVNDNVEFALGYEGKFREDYQDHTGLVNLKYKF